jgi:hypothetical protein
MADPTRSTASTEPQIGPRRAAGELSALRIGIHLGLVLAVVTGFGALLGGGHAALSGALGVALCAANLLIMRRIAQGLTAAEGGSAVWALALPVKLVVLVAAAFLLVHTRTALAFPLALGFAALPLTSVFLPQPSSVRGRA